MSTTVDYNSTAEWDADSLVVFFDWETDKVVASDGSLVDDDDAAREETAQTPTGDPGSVSIPTDAASGLYYAVSYADEAAMLADDPNYSWGTDSGLWWDGTLLGGLSGTLIASIVQAVTSNGNQIATDRHQYNARTVIRGDSYGSTSREFVVVIQSGSNWPEDLTSYTLSFASSLNRDNDNDGSALTGSVTLETATGSSRAVRVTLTSTVTSAAAPGEHNYAVRASLTGGIDWTLELGTITVKDSPAET